ncbi:hypothetical protein DRP05_08740 [Archaeoglobales archaeon]|nr:MAG: hypothetical protein DRP05_08740 [Archaeoglobales archaeon]
MVSEDIIGDIKNILGLLLLWTTKEDISDLVDPNLDELVEEVNELLHVIDEQIDKPTLKDYLADIISEHLEKLSNNPINSP